MEYLAIDDARVGLFPPGCAPRASAGALPLGALTALCALRDAARARRGQRILIVGAGGAVGTAVLQLARVRGIEADAVAGASGLELCARLGAQEVVDHHDAQGVELLRRGRYDAVVLAAGRAEDWIEAVRPAGRMALTRPATAWPRPRPCRVRPGRHIRCPAHHPPRGTRAGPRLMRSRPRAALTAAMARILESWGA